MTERKRLFLRGPDDSGNEMKTIMKVMRFFLLCFNTDYFLVLCDYYFNTDYNF